MGEEVAQQEFTREDRTRYREKVRRCLDVFALMLRQARDEPAVLEGLRHFATSGRDGTELRLDAGPELHNHLGGPHAAVIFGLGETAAFGLLLEVFGDLVEAGVVPLIKSGQIDYTQVATGPWHELVLMATTFPGMILWGGNTNGPQAAPGRYTVKLTANGQSYTQTFVVKPDPRAR